MAGEEWARRIIERTLNKTVHLHDDGSASAMYDLRVGQADSPEVAIECVGAVDSSLTETWNIGPAKGPMKLSLAGDWNVDITPKTRVKTIRQTLEPLLQELESRHIKSVHVDHYLKWQEATLFEKLEVLGIAFASCFRMPGSGIVHLSMPGRGGVVDTYGESVPQWIAEFLRDPSRLDVISKLQASGVENRHVFVIVTLDGAPWSVESYLTGELDYLPTQPPDLPPPVTGVWIVSGMGRKGLRWDGNSWSTFDARGEGIDK